MLLLFRPPTFLTVIERIQRALLIHRLLTSDGLGGPTRTGRSHKPSGILACATAIPSVLRSCLVVRSIPSLTIRSRDWTPPRKRKCSRLPLARAASPRVADESWSLKHVCAAVGTNHTNILYILYAISVNVLGRTLGSTQAHGIYLRPSVSSRFV
jgi:hypothetical protein